jgi:hypothetical protein
MSGGLQFGDILRLTNFKNRYPEPPLGQKFQLIEAGYNINPKGTPKDQRRVFVAVLLGSEDIDGKTPLDLEKAMNRIGWYRKPE